jgi:hypothetical protein
VVIVPVGAVGESEAVVQVCLDMASLLGGGMIGGEEIVDGQVPGVGVILLCHPGLGYQ